MARIGHRSAARLPGALRRGVLAASLLVAAGAGWAGGQSPGHAQRGMIASRAELETAAAEAERAQRADEAAAVRARLREGDLQVGDRIVLVVAGESTLTDTFTVRAGRALLLPNLPEIPLHGVLRSELRDYLTTVIGRYVRDPSVQATSLIRLAVLGEVARPGFYPLPADMLVSDAIMTAGGPTQNADLTKTVVRRGAADLLTDKRLRAAIVRGATLDQLNLRAGDEVVVGAKRTWMEVVRNIGYLAGIVASLYWATTL